MPPWMSVVQKNKPKVGIAAKPTKSRERFNKQDKNGDGKLDAKVRTAVLSIDRSIPRSQVGRPMPCLVFHEGDRQRQSGQDGQEWRRQGRCEGVQEGQPNESPLRQRGPKSAGRHSRAKRRAF